MDDVIRENVLYMRVMMTTQQAGRGDTADSYTCVARVMREVASMDDAQIRGLLEDLWTPAEVDELAQRIAICQLLLDGKTQRAVAAELGISVTTVSRGARILKYGSGTVASML